SHDQILPLLQILRPIDSLGLREPPLYRPALRLQIVPDDPVPIRATLIHHLPRPRHPRRDRLPLRLRTLPQPRRLVQEHLPLPPRIRRLPRLPVIALQTMPMHTDSWQIIPLIRIPQITRPLDERRPARQPQPELTLHV